MTHKKIISGIACAVIILSGWYGKSKTAEKATINKTADTSISSVRTSDFTDLKYYTSTVVKINGDKPMFKKSDMKKKYFIRLSDLDSLGRAGSAEMCAYYKNIAHDERGDISSVRPSGWHQAFIRKNGKSTVLYNRCHIRV